MSKNGIASCKKDLMVLKHFNLETPSYLLANKYGLDRHTIQKYGKENLFNEQTLLKNEVFKYLRKKYLNKYDNPNVSADYRASFHDLKSDEGESDCQLPLLTTSSKEEISNENLKISQTSTDEKIDLFEGITESNRKEAHLAINNELSQDLSDSKVIQVKDIKRNAKTAPPFRNPAKRDKKKLEEELCRRLNFWEIEYAVNSIQTVPSNLNADSTYLNQIPAIQR